MAMQTLIYSSLYMRRGSVGGVIKDERHRINVFTTFAASRVHEDLPLFQGRRPFFESASSTSSRQLQTVGHFATPTTKSVPMNRKLM